MSFITRDFHGLEKDCLGTMHTSDQKISGFTPSFEALGRLLKKKKNDENSDFAISRVERRRFRTTHKAFLWLEKGQGAMSVRFWRSAGRSTASYVYASHVIYVPCHPYIDHLPMV